MIIVAEIVFLTFALAVGADLNSHIRHHRSRQPQQSDECDRKNNSGKCETRKKNSAWKFKQNNVQQTCLCGREVARENWLMCREKFHESLAAFQVFVSVAAGWHVAFECDCARSIQACFADEYDHHKTIRWLSCTFLNQTFGRLNLSRLNVYYPYPSRISVMWTSVSSWSHASFTNPHLPPIAIDLNRDWVKL